MKTSRVNVIGSTIGIEAYSRFPNSRTPKSFVVPVVHETIFRTGYGKYVFSRTTQARGAGFWAAARVCGKNFVVLRFLVVCVCGVKDVLGAREKIDFT